MSGIGQIIPLAEGLTSGLMLTETKRLEDSVHAGRNAYFTPILQIVQANATAGMANLALEAAGQETIPLPLRIVVCLTAPLLAVLTQPCVGIENDTLRAVIVFLQDQFSNLCHVIALVASVALIYFGNVFYGAASLTMLGIGFLDRHKLLPECVRQIIHEYSPPLMSVTGILFGDIITRIFSAVSAISYGVGVFIDWHEKQDFAARAANVPQDTLTEQDMKDILSGRKPLEINPDYVHCSADPVRVPDIDIQELVDAFKGIDWSSKNIAALRRKLGNDQRFTQRHGDPKTKSDQELKEICILNLEICTDAVKNHRFEAGELKDYEPTHNNLKIIAHDFKQVKPYTSLADQDAQETFQIDILSRLSVEGGRYCGPGVADVAEEGKVGIIGESELFTTRAKMLNCLQEGRGRMMEEIYALAFGMNPELRLPHMDVMGVVVDWQDRHNVNVFKNMWANEFRIRKEGADNDSIAIVDPLMKLCFSHAFGWAIKDFLWKKHNMKHALETVHEAIGTPMFPKPLVYFWLQGWIDNPKHNLSDIERADLHEWLTEYDRLKEMGGPTLFGHKVEERRTISAENLHGNTVSKSALRFSDQIIQAMLFDMGILRDPTAAPTAAPAQAAAPVALYA